MILQDQRRQSSKIYKLSSPHNLDDLVGELNSSYEDDSVDLINCLAKSLDKYKNKNKGPKKEIFELENKINSFTPYNKSHGNRIKELEVENDTLRNQVDNLKLNIKKFTIGSNVCAIVPPSGWV